jgi:tRNA (guanine-N7-)-methyltransferase
MSFQQPHEFSHHALRLEWPPSWEGLFGRAAPLVLEVGFGNGRFLLDLAQHYPEKNILGIERAHKPLAWTEDLILRKGVGNIRLLHGDGLMCLYYLFAPGSLSEVHINFSDPWHKKRHHGRRLINPHFLRVLTDRLAIGAPLYIATDISQYAGEIGLALGDTPGLKNAYASPWMSQREEPQILTHYERKAIRDGRPCHYMKWRRTPAPLPPVPLLQELLPMPNVHLTLPFGVPEVIEAAASRPVFRHQGRTVRLMGVYRDPQADRLLLDTVIDEPLFNQRLMIEFEGRGGDHYLLQLAPVGHPRATRGVHDAVYFLSRWLLGLREGGALLKEALLHPDEAAGPEAGPAEDDAED